MNTFIKELDPVQYFGRAAAGYTTAEERIIRKALGILRGHINTGYALTSSTATKNYCQLKIGRLEHEVFGILFLNTQHEILSFEEISRGTIDAASVYPREVMKRVLANNASAVIFTHNHPSGIIGPSIADKQVTTKLSQALALIDVKVLDHIIVGLKGTYSFAENNEYL